MFPRDAMFNSKEKAISGAISISVQIVREKSKPESFPSKVCCLGEFYFPGRHVP